MSEPAATPIAPPTPAPAAPGEHRPSRFGRVLNVVRKLIDYGKELATAFQRHATTATDLAAVTQPFGTSDIGLILARITRGLLLANALEARIVALAARPAAPPRPASAGATCTARAACRPSGQARQGGGPSPCPSAHPGADRRRGPAPADRRGHRRHLSRSRRPADPSAMAGTEPRHHLARRQLQPPVQGHLRSGAAKHLRGPI